MWDFMQFAQNAIFHFDMSQLNLNNFWMDRATELRLDAKDAFFQAVSSYDAEQDTAVTLVSRCF